MTGVSGSSAVSPRTIRDSTLKLYLCPWTNASHWRQKFFQFFSKFFGLFNTSLRLPLQIALHVGHVYCLWPLPCILLLLVCTPSGPYYSLHFGST